MISFMSTTGEQNVSTDGRI